MREGGRFPLQPLEIIKHKYNKAELNDDVITHIADVDLQVPELATMFGKIDELADLEIHDRVSA